MDITVKLFQWALLLFFVSLANGEVKIKDFTMRTIDVEHFTMELGDVSCSFVYQALGGTIQEDWVMRLENLDEDQVKCTVYRGQKSRMYIDTFTFRIFGVRTLTHHETVNTETTPLLPSEYNLNHEHKMLHATKGFQHHIEKLVLVGIKHYSDL